MLFTFNYDTYEFIANVHAVRIWLFAAVMENHHDVLHIDMDGVHTNIVMLNMLKPGLSAEAFCEELEQVHFLSSLSCQVQKSCLKAITVCFKKVYGIFTAKRKIYVARIQSL